MEQRRVKENYLGVRGWVWAGRYQIERYLYFLHRLTGLGLVFYGALHMIVIRGLLGKEAYDAVMNFFDHRVF